MSLAVLVGLFNPNVLKFGYIIMCIKIPYLSNALPASGKFCCLLIIFANSLDPDHDRQNVRPDLDPNHDILQG